MVFQSRNLSIALTYAGAIPFWAFVLVPGTVAGVSTAYLFATYGAIIASFMAGTLWGQLRGAASDLAVLAASNLIALMSFATLMLSQPVLSIAVQMPLFWLLLAADYRICSSDDKRLWYLRLRFRVTLVVSLAYGVMLLGMNAHAPA